MHMPPILILFYIGTENQTQALMFTQLTSYKLPRISRELSETLANITPTEKPKDLTLGAPSLKVPLSLCVQI